jgi:hypothetical protein
LSFITKLNPVTYNLNVHRENEICGINNTSEWQGKYDIEKITQTGFLAQEVEQAAKACNYDFNGVQAPAGTAKLYSIQYAAFVMPLVKAVQELNATNEELKMENAVLKSEAGNQKSEIEILKSEVENLKRTMGIAKPSTPNEASAVLYQNSPNPFTEKTTIHYFIPASAHQAEIKVYSADGRELKSFLVTGKEYGQIEINGNILPAGIYSYTLVVDGKTMDSKQMVLTR